MVNVRGPRKTLQEIVGYQATPQCIDVLILPVKQGIMLGQYLGAFNLMENFRGRSKKLEGHCCTAGGAP
ncbi:unnamed protein product [Pleuronectes platessa]|uniref:Uncharacterized protein n=1 Tax=Pleuronectes platessa TaxID=8262 RepID=A0A9N7UDV3_PLEPL|nr:unnamed protein product [Pleuronectes platessa]